MFNSTAVAKEKAKMSKWQNISHIYKKRLIFSQNT
jgi:hypothetical protein